MTRFFLTASGKDRPGIVSKITKVLFDEGYDIEDSTMAILAGRFSMLFAVAHAEEKSLESLLNALEPLKKEVELILHCDEIEDASENKKSTNNSGEIFSISISGGNKSGIVYRASKVLFDFGINIISIETRIIATENTPIYLMLVEAKPTRKIDMIALNRELKRTSEELDVDIRINSMEPVTL